MANWPYNTSKLAKLRVAKLSDRPLCEICERRGLIVAAVAVDHFKPVRQGGHPFPELSALLSLCERCHNEKTAAFDKHGADPFRRRFKGVDADGKGHHTWTETEIARFYEFYKPGSLAHTAMVLMLWTGAARADVVKLGWFSIKPTPEGERLQYTRQKTGRMKNAVLISMPIAPELRAVLDTLPKDLGTFLQTKDGRQRSAKALTGDMRAWCDVAGLPKCNNHGLRKAIAHRMAEAGASPFMVGAVTGHRTLSEVERYTAAHDRGQLAERGIALLSGTKPEEKLANNPEKFAKKSSKDMK